MNACSFRAVGLLPVETLVYCTFGVNSRSLRGGLAILWRMEVVRDGQSESLTADLPAAYFVENWDVVTQAVGPYASIRLVSDGGLSVVPVGGFGRDLVTWFRVEPSQAGEQSRPGLRAALAQAENLARGNASKSS